MNERPRPPATNQTLLRDDVVDALAQTFLRDSIYHQMFRHESWESKLKHEIWRRSLRGRWWWFTYRLAERTEPARRRIARRIYDFREYDD